MHGLAARIMKMVVCLSELECVQHSIITRALTSTAWGSELLLKVSAPEEALLASSKEPCAASTCESSACSLQQWWKVSP